MQPPPPGNTESRFQSFFTDAAFTFRDVRFVAQYGTVYHLAFRLGPEAGLSVQPTTSGPIVAAPCDTADFYVPGDTQCLRCPAGAVCDGGPRLVSQRNRWRMSEHTRTFLRCPDFVGDGTCLANRSVGACAAGHRGPLCGDCARGWAGRPCTDCRTINPVGRLVGFCLGASVVLLWTLFRAYQQDAESKRLLTISMWKRTLNFLQTLGAIQPVLSATPLLQVRACVRASTPFSRSCRPPASARMQPTLCNAAIRELVSVAWASSSSNASIRASHPAPKNVPTRSQRNVPFTNRCFLALHNFPCFFGGNLLPKNRPG